MALVEFASSALSSATRNMRRRATGYLAAGILFSAAALYAAAAALIALEAAIGPVGARLVLAALCVLAGAVILFAVRRNAQPSRPMHATQKNDAAKGPRQLQLAMIMEALLLGFSMSRRKGARGR